VDLIVSERMSRRQTRDVGAAAADKTLDVKGLNCPLPIFRARKALKEVPPGGTLEILATDPGSIADFQAFCAGADAELVESSTSAGVCRFLTKRTA
jgi:tRNA 2-thiouridine synthesizing protein A